MSKDDKDLLNIAARKTSEPIKVRAQSKVDDFIIEHNIRPGEAKVPALVLKYMFKDWSKWHRKKITIYQFFKEMSSKFQKTVNKGNVYYKLEPKPFDLSQEHIWKLRRRQRLERQRSGKKTKKENSQK